ncbi:MAG: hypothetical protein K2L45_11250 [Muribaculaceae bacterium]|nr:hypothetical protein [Muribaculaceae bacterium]
MQDKYRKHIEWWLDEFGSGDQVDRYVDVFPELDTRLAKFAVGIYLWNAKGLIDINNPDDVSKIRMILRVLDQTPGYDFFDNVFNEADPDTVCQIIGISPVTPIEESHIDFDYTVMEIKNYEDAHSYFEAVSWCIVISEESFKEYTGNGNRFYFCRNGDWWDIPCIPGMGFPHDNYGYSLIAVEITRKIKLPLSPAVGTYVLVTPEIFFHPKTFVKHWVKQTSINSFLNLLKIALMIHIEL